MRPAHGSPPAKISSASQALARLFCIVSGIQFGGKMECLKHSAEYDIRDTKLYRLIIEPQKTSFNVAEVKLDRCLLEE